MSTTTPVAAPAPDTRLARPVGRPSLGSLGAGIVMAVLAGLGIWSVLDLGIDVPTIVGSLGNAVNFAGRMLPLDFPPAAELAGMILETLAIVVLSTVLAVVLSVPVALAAGRATTAGRITRGTARTLIVLARAVPDLVLAIVFLRLFGLGPVAGILAMGLHSVGMIGKLYADAIEELDDAPREAVEAVGSSRRQQIWSAIPQALLPQVVATALHRFDINLRTSVLLGYVGVGGIGLAIADALRSLDYQRGMSLALVVLALCIAVELLSGAVRAALLPGGGRSLRSTWADRLLDRSSGGRTSPSPVRAEAPWSVERIRRLLGGLAVVVVTLAALQQVKISPTILLDGLFALPETMALFVPPGFGGAASTVLADLLVTLQVALAATLLGAIVALPIGILAARNVVAHRAVHTGFRLLIVIIRGIPELILAISATLLGVVGAGGVGFLLLNAARVNQFDVVTAIVLLMIAVVLAVEALSIWLRRAVR